MTSIYFDPAIFEAPAEREPAEQLIVNGRYYLPPIGDPTGKRRSLQRVTNFIKQLSDTAGLEKWKLRSVVEGLVLREDLYDLACSLDLAEVYERDQIIERCIDAAKAYKGSGGNETGTALHNYTDAIGKEPMRVRPKWAPKVENYQKALHAKGLRPVPGLSERLVVSERYGTCGRLDDVYEDPFGVLRVGDRKSQKEFYTWWEIGAQLALYQCSEAIWNEAECRFEEMPKLAGDYAHVAWMPLNHPAAKKGGDVDEVTIYDLPLDGARKILDWCAEVRALRTQARQWGKERADLDGFARLARDIRDAESHDDLRRLLDLNPDLSMPSNPLYQMAFDRWDALQPPPSSGPAVTPLSDTVRVALTSNYAFGTDEQVLTITGTQYAVEQAAQQLMPQRLTVRGHADAAAIGFDPALFVAPAQDATFPAESDGVPGGDADAAGPGGLTQAHPIAIAPYANPGSHHDATVVELPSAPDDEAPASAGLDSVPIKIVREVCTRANNSQSSRGRVRLLNDLGKKYARHQDALLPALLREWLTIDGGPTSMGAVKLTEGSSRSAMGAKDAGQISLSGYLATKDGAPTGDEEGSAAPAQGDDVQLRGSVDISKAITLPRAAEIEAAVERFVDELNATEEPGLEPYATQEIRARRREEAGQGEWLEVAGQEIRKQYAGIEPDRHSMLRLIELAKDAQNGAERAKVFHEITRRRAWKGSIAAEINQHYLDNGYATEDFDPYFEAVAIEGSALPLDPDDPATAADAIHLLEGAETLAQLQGMWTQLAKLPFFHEQILQEALMARFAKVKA